MQMELHAMSPCGFQCQVLYAMAHGHLLSLLLAQSLSGHAWWCAEPWGKLRP